MRRESERDRLLFPEWMNWGERFERCSAIDRIVWAQTRGFVGDYEGKWKRELFRSVPEPLSGREVADALKRYNRWMIRTKRFDNYSPNTT
jgi:hypothetical protein